ncbi:MAG: DMT family transporter [Chloroflexi bacterium]|nr:MAG: DMT family transporter [Chloroflexota bacterium]
MSRRSPDARAPAVLLALGCVWGASFLFIKVLVDDTGPLEVAAGRLCIGAVAILTFIRLRGLPLPSTPSLVAKVSVLALVANIAPFVLIAWGEEHIESGTASVLNSTMPLFTAIFAVAVLPEERFTKARAAGLVVGFLGVLVMTGDEAFDLTNSDVLGQLAVILSSACYGVGSVFSRTLLRSTDPIGLSALQVTAGAVLCVPILLVVEGSPDYSLSIESWLCLLLLGAGATGVAYVAYLWLIDVTGSVRASLVTYIIPVVGLFLGWAVLDESIGPNTLFGSALIIGGVAMVLRGGSPGTQVRRVAQAVVAAD